MPTRRCGRDDLLGPFAQDQPDLRAASVSALNERQLNQRAHFDSNLIGMRWAEWTAGGRVPDEVLDNLLNVLAHGLPPRSEDGPYRLNA